MKLSKIDFYDSVTSKDFGKPISDREWPTPYQLVGKVMAYQGDDG